MERTTKRRRHVLWVEGFAPCFSSVHGRMGMNVWVNVSFLRADSGPWRKMSRAWPAMSAITTSSGSTCQSHQESAWGAAEARQEKVIVEVVSKRIVAGRCWNICWTRVQMFSVSTVLGEKASEVEQPRGADASLPGRRPPPHWTGRGPANESVMIGQLSVFLFWGVCTGVWEWLCEWMSLQCHSCAQILYRGERCLGRDLQYPRKRQQAPRVRVTGNQPGELLNPGRKMLFWRLLKRPLLSGNVGVCVEHVCKCFLSVLF